MAVCVRVCVCVCVYLFPWTRHCPLRLFKSVLAVLAVIKSQPKATGHCIHHNARERQDVWLCEV